jgi:hypothetical protein
MPTCRAIWRSKWRRPGSPTGVSSRLQAAAAHPIGLSGALNGTPYAGGEVRRFALPSMSERLFGVHRPITITARLYLGGAYLRLASEQAIIEGGRRDPELSAVIVRLTQDLLARGVDNPIDSLPLSVSR